MCKIKIVLIISVILLCVCFVNANTQRHFTVGRYGKPIQVDGFLIEWQEDNAGKFGDSLTLILDAMNTPQGLAGYFRYGYTDSCKKIVVKFYPEMKAIHTYLTLDTDTLPPATGPLFYAVDKPVEGGGATAVVAEWFIPWSYMSLDSLEQYEVGLITYSACGDTLGRLVLSGKRYHAQGGVMNTKIVIQIISIMVLLALFILLRAKAKRLYKH